MFLLLYGRHVGATSEGHQHGVTIQSSTFSVAVLCIIVFRLSEQHLGKVVYIAGFQYHTEACRCHPTSDIRHPTIAPEMPHRLLDISTAINNFFIQTVCIGYKS